MLSAVEGRLDPYTTGKVYCSLISACEQLGDLRRAAEWTDATTRWSERHPLAMWPGICRVHHASLLQLRGDWGAAEREARRACAELDGFHVPNVAAGYVEIGEIRRRLGDLDGAEEAFAKAEELCGQQTAGLALVRLAQRRVDAATAIITRMLAEQTWNQLARGKLLPARVQIAVAAGDLDTAAAAADELERIAAELRQPGPVRRRAVLTGPAPAGAGRRRRRLRHAARGARSSGSSSRSPTRSPPSRLLLGQACRNCGDEDGATRSFASAAAIFDRLGAALDARHLRDLTSSPPRCPPGSPPGRPRCSRWSRRGRQQGDRRRAAPQRADRRPPPVEHLHQDRRDLAHRGRGLRLRERPRQPPALIPSSTTAARRQCDRTRADGDDGRRRAGARRCAA